MLEKLFPKTIFVEQWKKKFGDKRAFTKQLAVVNEELLEAQGDYAEGNHNKAIEELADVMQAASTAMRMIPGYTDQKANDAIKMMIKKNNDRDYYE